MGKELNIYTIWRWKLNGKWSIETRKLLFANIALVFSYSQENIELCEDSMMRSSINQLVESLCLENGFANPYEIPFDRLEYDKRVMNLSDDEYFDWKWPYALNKMILTRGEDDLSRYLFDQLLHAMREDDLSLSYYYCYFRADYESDDYGYRLLDSFECQERRVRSCRRIDIKPQEDCLNIGEVQVVAHSELFKNVIDDAEICIEKMDLRDYVKEILLMDIKHKDINLIKDGINTKRIIINKDFSICVPSYAESTEASVFKKNNDVLEWKMEFSLLDTQDKVIADEFVRSEITRQIPDYDVEIENDNAISNDDLTNLLMRNQIMEENTYYILHSFPEFGTGKVDISLADAMAYDSKIARCYRGIVTIHYGTNCKQYKVNFEGILITRSVDVIDLFSEMLRSIRLEGERPFAFRESKTRTLRYSSCALNFAMDVPESRFNTVLNIEDGKDIG